MVSPSDWERTRASFATAPARPSTPRSGTSVATKSTKVNPAPVPEQSMFGQLGAAASTVYNAIPQPVKTVAKNLYSGEEFLNTISGDADVGTAIRSRLDTVPYAGGLLGTAFDIGTSPLTWLTAGFGGYANAGLRTLGTAGKVAGALLSPVSSGNFGSRLFSEIVAGTGGSFAAEKAAENDFPLVAQIGAGALGGMTALGLKGMVTGALTPRQGPAIAAERLATNLNGRTFLNSPRAFDDLVAEIKPPSNAIEETAVGRAVNSVATPSKNLDPDDIGVLVLAHKNQRTTGHQLADVGVSSALDTFDRGTLPAVGWGGAVFDIDDKGFIRNIVAPNGKPTQILDVLSNRNAPSVYKFTPDQTAYFDAYHSFVAETRDLAEQYGVKMPKKTLDEDSLYVMRVALGTEDVDFKRLGNPFMKRLYEDAQDAVAAGVRYENDPRTIALLQAQSVYNQIADAQFETAMAPRLVTAKQALVKMNSKVVADVSRTAKQYGEALKAGRQERDTVLRELRGIEGDRQRMLRGLGAARQRLGTVVGEIRGRNAGAVTNGDRRLFRLYEQSQAVDDALKKVADLDAAGHADSAAHGSAQRELTKATGQLSRALGEVSERAKYSDSVMNKRVARAQRRVDQTLEVLGNARTTRSKRAAARRLAAARADLEAVHRARGTGITAQSGEDLLTATRGQQVRATTAQKRLENAQQLVRDTKPDTKAFRAAQRELADARRALVRLEASMQTEASAAARQSRMPVALGQKAGEAQAAVDEMQAALDELQTVKKGLPNVRTRNGAPITATGQMRAGEAKDAFLRAKNLYQQELERVVKSESLPEYVFGRNDSTKNIRVGQWKGKFLPETDDYLKLAKEMNMMTGRPNPVTLNPLAKGLEQTGNLVRYASANADFGMPFIQGLHLLGQDPVAWTKMATAHYKAAFDPSYGARYLRNNLTEAQELAALDVPLGDVEQYIAGKGRTGRRIADSAIGRQTMKRFEGAYAVGSTASRIEAYKALKPHWDGTADELATYIRNLTGAQSSAALGVSPSMRALESTWLAFSPRMFRSTAALVMHAADPSSAVGRQAAKSLLGLAGVATTMAVSTRIGIGLASGESADDIQKGVEDMLNPTSGRKFLSLPIGGQYVGVGGQVRSITQFVAKAMVNPAGFATADALENPLINFYMGRGAVGVNIVGAAAEGLSGGSVDVLPFSQIDNPVDAMFHIGRSVFPFAVQAQWEAENSSMLDRTTLLLSSTAGLNSSPKTAANRIDELAQRQYGKPYFELTGKEQQGLEDERPDLFELKAKDKSDFGNAEERTRIRAIQRVDSDRISQERALVDALNRNRITADQFRDAMKEAQKTASVKKRTLYGEESFKGASDANKEAVSGWYTTFDAAKVEGTDVVDWNLHDQIEAQYISTLTPEQRRYVDERRVTRHAPEAQPYFEREEQVRDSGYYDAAENAFDRFRAGAPPGVLSYSDLALAIQRATLAGDRLSLVRLKRFQSRIDRVADQVKTRMRRENPDLDAALVLNGRVSKPASRATVLGG